jgi:hypothetical protein
MQPVETIMNKHLIAGLTALFLGPGGLSPRACAQASRHRAECDRRQRGPAPRDKPEVQDEVEYQDTSREEREYLDTFREEREYQDTSREERDYYDSFNQ